MSGPHISTNLYDINTSPTSTCIYLKFVNIVDVHVYHVQLYKTIAKLACTL